MFQFSLTRTGIRDCVFVLSDNNNGVGRFSSSIFYLLSLILIKQYYKQLSIAQNFIAELTQSVASFVAHYSNFDIDLKYLARNLYSDELDLSFRAFIVQLSYYLQKPYNSYLILDVFTTFQYSYTTIKHKKYEFEQTIILLIPYFCVRYDRL